MVREKVKINYQCIDLLSYFWKLSIFLMLSMLVYVFYYCIITEYYDILWRDDVLCYTMIFMFCILSLLHVTLYCGILCYAILYYIIQCTVYYELVILVHSLIYCTVLYHTTSHYISLCCVVLYYIVLYFTISCHHIWYII